MGKHSICLVSDFFWPNIGGVENHIYQLALCLQQRGHKVIVVTRAYGKDYTGVKFLPEEGAKGEGVGGNVKVYYIPRLVVGNQVSLPTVLPFFTTFHDILEEEKVTIVHGHQSSSPLVHECICIGRLLGCKTVLTEHSLYGMSERLLSFESIINKFLEITLCHVDHVICVSEKCRENLISRTNLIAPPEVVTIPNAINSWEFEPDHSKRSPRYPSVNVVLLSRLVPRKGIDLVEQVIPVICGKFPQVHFIIGGGGPRKSQLQAMIDRCDLGSRVEMLGFVQPRDVRDVLVRGHIFLNCSFTESFCISLMEAASCGLKVVSTNVGGVPEVLPPDLITLADPAAPSVVMALSRAIEATLADEADNSSNVVTSTNTMLAAREASQHERVKSLNSWMSVALMTEKVYSSLLVPPDSIITDTQLGAKGQSLSLSLANKMACYAKLGWVEYLFAVSLLFCLEAAALVTGRGPTQRQSQARM